MNPNYRYPLAHDLDGEPIQLPAEAIAWRVRRRSGKQGRPQCVYHHETGAQLVIPLDATIDALVSYGPGFYRLDAIDKDGKVIPSVVAYTEVPRQLSEEEPDDGGNDGDDSPTEREQLNLIRQLVESNVRVMEAMASAFGKVRPVEDLPMPVTMPSPVAQPQPVSEKFGAKDLMEMVQVVVPMLPQLKMAFDYVMGRAPNPVVASAPPVDAAAPGGLS